MIKPGETVILLENARGFAAQGQELIVQEPEYNNTTDRNFNEMLRVTLVDNPHTPFFVPKKHVRLLRLSQSVAEKIKEYADEVYDEVENLQAAVSVRSQQMLHDIVDEWGHEIVYALATEAKEPLSYHLGEDYAELTKVVNHLFEAQMILDKLRNDAG